MTAENGKYFRRNFVLGVATGAFINVGMAFIDPVTVLPVFISKLGGSAALIGFVSALHGVGWFLPQVFASRLAETRRRLIHMYRFVAAVRIAAFFGVVYAVLFGNPLGGQFFLPLFVSTLLVAHLAGGFSAIPFLEITSKTIPVTRRGGFFGMRRLIGGILGIGAGMLVAVILDRHGERLWMDGPWFGVVDSVARRTGLLGHDFPVDFAVIFLLGAIAMALGMLTFSFAGEMPATRVEKSARFLNHLRSGVALLKEDADYRRFYLVRICWQFTAMAFPFYVTFAYSDLGLPENLVGLFLSIWVGSGVFSNLIWGRILDRRGNKIVLLTTAILSVLPPVIVLALAAVTRAAAPPLGAWGILFAISSTFLINGVVRSGRIISNITYLLEFAPEARRPLYVGFMNSFTFPFMLSPLLAGVVIQFLGIQPSL
jgi:MFS family permease